MFYSPQVLTHSSRSGFRKVPSKPPPSSNLGKSAASPISVYPIDIVPLTAIRSSALVSFSCPTMLSRSLVEPKVPKIKSVSRGPSIVDPHSSPPPKPFAAPVAPLEVPSPPVSTAEGASQLVSTRVQKIGRVRYDSTES